MRVDPFDLGDAVIVTSTNLVNDAQWRLRHEVLILKFHLSGRKILLDRRKIHEQSSTYGSAIDTSGEVELDSEGRNFDPAARREGISWSIESNQESQ